MMGSLLVAFVSLRLLAFGNFIYMIKLISTPGELLAFGITYGLVPGLVVVTGGVFGNALQRQAQYVSTPPAARSHGPSTTGTGGNWSTRAQVLWGFAASILATLLSVIGQGLIEAYISNGG
jgi:hypothetical protein